MNNVINILNDINNINWVELVHAMVPIWQLNMLYKQDDSSFIDFHLRKDKQFSDIQYIALPPELVSYYKGIDFKYIGAYQFGESISQFAQMMIDKFPSKNLIMLYNNINELKVKTYNDSFHMKMENFKNLIFKKGNTDYTRGGYRVFFNSIKVSNNDGEICLPHELFHMATSFKDKKRNVIYCGFYQNNGNSHQRIGNGFNEGYTELMTQKYYGDEYISTSKKYILLRGIMGVIEKIIGKDKMENFYLNSDLNGLVNEMAQYVQYDEVLKFVSSMDYLYKNVNNAKKTEQEQLMLFDKLLFVNKFIILIGTCKPIKQLHDNEIKFDDLIPNIHKNVNETFNITLRNRKYNVSPSAEEMSNMIISILNSYGINTTVNVEQKSSSILK